MAQQQQQQQQLPPEIISVFPPARLNLFVIRSQDVLAAARFYSAVFGLSFKLHQHGPSAPQHYACESPEFVFEIYPATKPTAPPTTETRLGFQVSWLNDRVDDDDDEKTKNAEASAETQKKESCGNSKNSRKIAAVAAACQVAADNGGHILSAAQDSPWGVRAVIVDLDGHRVECVACSDARLLFPRRTARHTK